MSAGETGHPAPGRKQSTVSGERVRELYAIVTREPASWAEAAKDVIGTAIDEASRVWFTLASGRLTEIYYPTPDRACTRALGLVLVGDDFVSEEHIDCIHTYSHPHVDVPLFSVVNRHRDDRYRIEKETIADPRSSAILQRVRWGRSTATRMVCKLEPHVANRGDANHAEVLEHHGSQVLTARRGGIALALACNRVWSACSAELAGSSGRLAELHEHRAPTTRRASADGSVVLLGELEVDVQGELVLSLAFAHTPHEAAHLALGALFRGYDAIRADYVHGWQAWNARRTAKAMPDLCAHSVTVLKTLESKRADGGRVAALATPWGPARGPGIVGTYHVVWTRDLVETLGGLLAADIHEEARQTIAFLSATQRSDGHWPHCMLLDGERVADRDERDETALPIVLIELLQRERAITERELAAAWPMVSRAADYLARTGPTTNLDRWEDTTGVTPFTLATEIVALRFAAVLARRLGDPRAASRFAEIAARWDAQIEALLYRTGGKLAAALGVHGYYVRARVPGEDFPELDLDHLPPTEVSVDALALVRFGLRDPDDPRIRNTVRVIDAILAVELPQGAAWRRYASDRYGEHADGRPFDGHGIGRPWPLLIGERAHYELARGDRRAAIRLQHVLEHCASETGMLSEQIWDAESIPERGLYRGKATGSASPLGWAHAEYVKLCRSLAEDRVFDSPREV
jgi:glucoamylase